ncbi:MAG: right-handed parallel beta-helix repeat-containing protein [Eubacteriales bacterium]
MDEIKLWKDGIHDDTAALQALLDKRGEVRVPDGRYLISKPLIIHDDTHLIVARNAVLRLADHVNCSLLDNDGLYERRVNRNITIEGGIWDGNNAAQEREWIPVEDLPCDYDKYISNSLIVLMIRLVHTEHLVVRDIILRDPTSYGIHIADARYFTVENVHFDYDLSKPNMDGVHIQGPARFGVIRNIMGDCNDDHVALCANGTTRSEITRGDIEDIDIDGIFCENGYTGIRLLSRGDAVRNINIRNVHGAFRLFAVSFTHHYPLHEDKPVLLENIHLSDLYVSKSTGYVPEDQIPAVINNSLV